MSNGNWTGRCIKCNANLQSVESKPDGGVTGAIPETKEILEKTKFKSGDNHKQILNGIAWSIFPAMVALSILARAGIAEGIYTGIPMIIIAFMIGYRRGND